MISSLCIHVFLMYSYKSTFPKFREQGGEVLCKLCGNRKSIFHFLVNTKQIQ